MKLNVSLKIYQGEKRKIWLKTKVFGKKNYTSNKF